MSATLDYWHERLLNWALWSISGSRVSISATDGLWDDGAPRPPLPLVGEALDTDTLLGKLCALGPTGREQFEAIRIKYCWSGTEEQKAQQSGVSLRTLNHRVMAAKYKLDDLYHARKKIAASPYLREGSNKVMLTCF